MRILKDYSEGEREEFKSIKAIYGYPLAFLTSKEFEDDCPNLGSLIRCIDTGSDDKQLLQDIADYINDKAEFAGPKYYVRFVNDLTDSYLNRDKEDNNLFIGYKSENSCAYQTQFTMDEIKDLGDKYVPFAIPVSEVNE